MAQMKAQGSLTIIDTNDVERIYVVYAKHTSNTNSSGLPVAENWKETIAAAPGSGDYIWQRTVIKKTGTNELSYSDPICVTGPEGDAAKNIIAIETQYGTSADWNTQPSSWSNDTPNYDSSKPNYWTRTRLKYEGDTYSSWVVNKDYALTKAIENSVLANSIAQSANENANGAMGQAANNINSVTRLWFAQATVSPIPTINTIITDGAANRYGAWSNIRPTDNSNYPYYYYCDQTITGGGVADWSIVTLDISTLSKYEIEATNVRTQNFFKSKDSSYDGWIASGRPSDDGLKENDAETFFYNARFGATNISLGYNKTPVINLDGSNGTINIYRLPTINSSTKKVTTVGSLGMQLGATSLNFYKPPVGNAAPIVAATLSSTGLDIVDGSIELANGTNNSIKISNSNFNRNINSISHNDLRMAIGSKFGVASDGTLYASGATINGAIVATSLDLTTNNVKINYSSINNTPDLSVYISKDGVIGTEPSDSAASSSTGFKVSSAGLLKAANAVITGKIFASSGTIGGWNIGTDSNKSLYYGNQVPGATTSNLVLSPTSATNTNAIAGSGTGKTWFISAGQKFGVDTSGTLYATGAKLDTITATNFSLNSGSINSTVTIGNKAQSEYLNSNIEVGGRNLFKGTKATTTNASVAAGNAAVGIEDGNQITVSVRVDADDVVWASSGYTRIGTEFSITKTGGGTQYIGAWAGKELSEGANIVEAFTGSFHGRVSKTFTLEGNISADAVTAYLYIQGVSSGTVAVSNVKVELGNKATDWTPAPEDIDVHQYVTRITDAGIRIHPSSTENNSVVIDGTSMRIYKGGTNDNNCIAEYGTSINLASNEATVTIGSTSKYHTLLTNSGMYFRNGANTTDKNLLTITSNEIKLYKSNTGTATVTINSSGKLTASDVDLTGKITANSGTIGGWNIGSTFLSTSTSGTPGANIITLSKGIAGPTSATGVLPANQTWAFTASNQFGVTTAGKLYATGAEIKGTIKADDGYIAGTLTIGLGGTTTLNTVSTNASDALANAAEAATKATNYIGISGSGIKVSHSNPKDTTTNYVEISGNGMSVVADSTHYAYVGSGGMSIYSGGIRASFGTNIFLYDGNNHQRAYINSSDGLVLGRWDYVNSRYTQITDGGLYVKRVVSTTDHTQDISMAEFSSSLARIGETSTGHAVIKSDGFHVWTGSESDSTNEVAVFGNTARIGVNNNKHITIDSTGLNIWIGPDNSENADNYQIAKIGLDENGDLDTRLGLLDEYHTSITSDSFVINDGAGAIFTVDPSGATTTGEATLIRRSQRNPSSTIAYILIGIISKDITYTIRLYNSTKEDEPTNYVTTTWTIPSNQTTSMSKSISKNSNTLDLIFTPEGSASHPRGRLRATLTRTSTSIDFHEWEIVYTGQVEIPKFDFKGKVYASENIYSSKRIYTNYDSSDGRGSVWLGRGYSNGDWTDNIGVYDNKSSWLIRSDGSDVYSNMIYSSSTTTSAANVRCWTGDGNHGRLTRYASSSKRYKTDIEDIIDAEALYGIPVRQFKYKEDYLTSEDQRFNQIIPGFIAEELEEIYPICVDKNIDNQPEDWNVRYLVPPMLQLIQNQKKEIDNLKERVRILEEK